jgi:hypothetical protein
MRWLRRKQSYEPLFETEFEKAVLDEAVEEIAPDVGRLLTESTRQTGWRLHR